MSKSKEKMLEKRLALEFMIVLKMSRQWRFFSQISLIILVQLGVSEGVEHGIDGVQLLKGQGRLVLIVHACEVAQNVARVRGLAAACKESQNRRLQNAASNDWSQNDPPKTSI